MASGRGMDDWNDISYLFMRIMGIIDLLMVIIRCISILRRRKGSMRR